MFQKRGYLFAMALAGCLFVAAIGVRSAGAQVLMDTGEGSINSIAGDNGNAVGGNYVAGGDVTNGNYRDHFDFSIPTLAGPLLTATLVVRERNGDLKGHIGPDTSFSVFSLGAFGTYGFADIGTGTQYGNTSLSTSSNGQIITIPLDGAAISAISGDQGASFSLGGVDSGESNSVVNVDFNDSTGLDAALVLTTGTVNNGTPEPGGAALVLGCCITFALALKRRVRMRNLAS